MPKVITLKRVNKKRDISLRVLASNPLTGEVDWVQLGKFPNIKAAKYKASTYGKHTEYKITVDGRLYCHHKGGQKQPPSPGIPSQAGRPFSKETRPPFRSR
jgi:hypothetical protein